MDINSNYEVVISDSEKAELDEKYIQIFQKKPRKS